MPFNPVKRVRQRIYPTQMQAKLAELLRRLADLPPALPTPYVTVSLDWRPEGSDPEYRAGLTFFEHEAHALQQQYWPRGEIFDSIGADIDRIRVYLTEELDPAAQGVFVVANSGANVFEAVAVGMPLENTLIHGPIPALLQLARLDEDYPTYAVLVADQQRATLSLIAQAHRVEALVLRSSDYPRKQHSGGWSQRRFQQRADERLLALARQISEETQRYLDERGIDTLVLAGDEVITSALQRVMPGDLEERVIEVIRLDIDATPQEILAATMPIAERAERKRELAAVRQVNDLYGQGATATTGSADVLDALSTGRVDTVLLNEDFHEDGWADYIHHRYGAGPPSDLFTTSDDELDVFPIPIEQEIARLAIGTGAEIDVIHAGVLAEEGSLNEPRAEVGIPRSTAARELDTLGGVAAILRY